MEPAFVCSHKHKRGEEEKGSFAHACLHDEQILFSYGKLLLSAQGNISEGGDADPFWLACQQLEGARERHLRNQSTKQSANQLT